MSGDDIKTSPASTLGRRELFQFSLAAAATAAVLTPDDALAVMRAPTRHLAFHNLHTGERLRAEYWSKGRYMRDGLKAINRILRDHRTGDVHPIDPGLLDFVYALQRRLGVNSPFHVISGYRSPETNAMLRESDGGGVARFSYHMEGRAIDLRMPGVPLRTLHRAALSLRRGGVGYYPSSNFVHVDTGPVRRW